MIAVAIAAGFGNKSLSDVESMLIDPNPNKFNKCRIPPPGGLYLANIEYEEQG